MITRRPWLPDMARLLPEDPGTPPPGGAPVPGPPPEATLTQSAVNALVTRETDRAQRAYRDQLLEKLGLKSIDDITAVVAAQKTAEQAQMTEQQRVTAAAEAERAAAATERQTLAAERLAMRTEQHLIRAGVPLEVDQDGKRIPNPQLAYALRLVAVDPTADENAIAAAVAQVKTDFPAMFATAAAPPPAGTPPVVRPPRTPAGGSTEPGASGRRALTEFGFVKRTPAG